MSQYQPLLCDEPSEIDLLDFAPYFRILYDVVTHEETSTPLTIGVYGDWGSGKTTLFRMLQTELKKTPSKHVVVWFNAWKYHQQDALWRALLLAAIDGIRSSLPAGEREQAEELLAETSERLYRSVEREADGGLKLDFGDLLRGSLETTLQIAMTAIPGLSLAASLMEEVGKSAATQGPGRLVNALRKAQNSVFLEQIRSVEQFHDHFRKLITRFVTPRARLILFVDDLDRCTPAKSIEVLEAIRLFFDAPSCVFLVAMNRQVILRAIAQERSAAGSLGADSRLYLEKMIQVPFELPPIEIHQVEEYVARLVPWLPDQRCQIVFARGLREPNPRRVKRMLNLFVLLSRLAAERKATVGELSPVLIAKLVVIQHSYPDLYAAIRLQPGLLRDLSRSFEYVGKIEGDATTPALPAEGLLERVQELGGDLESLGELLRLFSDDPAALFGSLEMDQLRKYLTLAASIAPNEAGPEHKVSWLEPQTVTIAAGSISGVPITRGVKHGSSDALLQSDHQLIATLPFRIGRYPVTNLEYQTFVRATGHTSPRTWKGSSAPAKLDDHPVVFVTYHDAQTYCAWLRSRTGKPYRLPTEREWLKAASWDDNKQSFRVFPWGDVFEANRCNTADSGRLSTTAVGEFSPKGDSFYGAADMCGNVREWCDFDEPGDSGAVEGTSVHRPLRGGSWFDYADATRCAERIIVTAHLQDHLTGFRVAL